MRILILGGTSEARRLAQHLSGDHRFDAIISLAGRTTAPSPLPLPTRIGGFGGAEGLHRYLVDERICAVIDATHPFAVRISANTVVAANSASVPIGSLVRPPWEARDGDTWSVVASPLEAAQALGEAPRRVFLTVGRLELAAFASAPQHTYIARTIDPAGDISLPPEMSFIQARPPFDPQAEEAFLIRERIDVIVSKNSGSDETYGKIAAARALQIPVVMIARPPKAQGVPLADIEAALAWLDALNAARSAHNPHDARSPRGV
ncbi:MAG: cobalt-precorrin-6A reductase [Hyphomicrobium sp.]|jgi:precorrin-6A/cobalt-precorrin-6A reductase